MKYESKKAEFKGRLKFGDKYDRIKYYQKLREAVHGDSADLSSEILQDIVERESK